MFRRILIPTDFSTASEWVFDDAVRIAGTSGAELVILHVRMTRTSQPGKLRFPADPSIYEYAEQQELDRLRERVRRANATLATRLIVRQAPDPGNEICRTAREEGADLIVIATHARHHVAHLIVGSTTLAVLHEPPAPVLAIRYGTRKRTSMSRVVVPLLLDEKSRAALDLAKKIAGEIHLVAVCEAKEKPRAEAMLREAAGHAPGAAVAVLEGDDAEREIVRYVARTDADAIFLNASAEPSEGTLDIIRHTPVPVMIVPA
ncbi:MAG TPA: universal stress protein [Thermoanaerobaculia bacterium]|nr:universal stress protein [Thermoanaerobaculia bacterium]